jgi:uncharacterized protein with PIN domain
MSTPLLTPAQTPIFDDLVISELEEHFDDEVPCVVSAEHAAEVRVQCRGCGTGVLACTGHAEKMRADVERMIAASLLGFVACSRCKRFGWSFDEIAKVVPL